MTVEKKPKASDNYLKEKKDMERRRFKPLVDKLFFILFIPTLLLLIAITVVGAFAPLSLLVVIPLDLFVLYFFVSPFFGYVEMRKTSLFIKYGFFMKKDIPYNRIRGVEKKRKFHTESMLSLKNAMEHVDAGPPTPPIEVF